jgi:hypothetical protein
LEVNLAIEELLRFPFPSPYHRSWMYEDLRYQCLRTASIRFGVTYNDALIGTTGRVEQTPDHKISRL